jgi:integrase
LELLIGSGMRISEALALQWDDIDFRRRVIRVYRSAKREGEGSTKGKRFRAVQAGPRLLDTMRELLGSVSSKLSQHAPTSLMVVRDG